MTEPLDPKLSTSRAENDPHPPVDNEPPVRGGEADPESLDEAIRLASAVAVARAKEAAKAKGLRPGGRLPRRATRRPDAVYSAAGADGRDPVMLGDQLDRLLVDRGWSAEVSVGAVLARWPAIVGPEVAQHVTPETFEEGVLVVRADSTAWATQLRYLAPALLERLQAEAGDSVVAELKVLGPAARSWRKGPRSAHGGRGPRDTYG